VKPFSSAQSMSMMATVCVGRQQARFYHGTPHPSASLVGRQYWCGEREKRKTHLPLLHNRDNNLAPARAVTRNVPGKRIDVGHKLRLARLRSSSAHAAAQRNRLARDLALERPEQQLARVRRVQEVEAGPVDGG
jgi:hypothetical protein